MADPVEVANAAADLADKTVLLGESNQEVTGLKSFKRAPDAPIEVQAGSAAVPNLDADKLDGEEGSAYHNASNLNAGTIPDARFPDPLPALSGENLHTLDASKLTGTIPDGSVPDPLPAVSGENLTDLPDPLPAVSGANLTNLDASELVGDIPDASVPAYVETDLGNARKISRGGTLVNPYGIDDAINIICWRAPFACTVTAVKGYRVGGSGATVNARRNGSEDFLASALSLTSADTWTDGGSVQNAALAAGDKVEIMIVSTTGSPTQLAVQVDIEIDTAKT